MFKTLSLLFLLPSISALGQVGYDHPWLETIPHAEGKHHVGIAKAAPPTRNFDIRYHRFTWSIDPAVRAISGNVTTYFSTTGDLDTLVFDLSDTLIVSQVIFHGNALPFSLGNGDLLRIALPATLPIGTLDSVSISYGGVPRLSGFGSFATGDHDGVPALWTLSEPYGAKEWWPCKQDLNDKIDSIDAFVTIPIGNRAAGNGVLATLDTLPGGSFVRYHWRHRYPIAHYLVATAVTNYQELVHQIALPNDTVLMLTYTYPEDAFIADLSAGDVAEQMVLFSELFGTYPFAAEKYGHAQFGWGGGMEHQTMSFMGGYYYELAAHELAHQWFGDKVTCSTWDDLWLNEGFATYLTGLCYNYIDTQYWQGWLQAKVAGVTSEPDGSVWVNDTLDIGRLFSGRLTYNKGAMVLHMLRWVCGDTAFYAGVNNYLNDPLLAFASASTADLKAHLEATSGLDLTEFFADWFYGEGHPIYTVPWSQDQSGTVSVQLDQSTSHPSVPFFEMPVPVRFWNSAEDTTVVFDHSFSGQTYSFSLPFQADSALLDPETWLVQANALIVRVPELSVQTERVLVYPNPAADEVTLYATSTSLDQAEMRVIDRSGRTMMSRSVRMEQQRTLVDLSGLSAGMYVLELRSADAVARVRVIKQ